METIYINNNRQTTTMQNYMLMRLPATVRSIKIGLKFLFYSENLASVSNYKSTKASW